MALCTVDGTVTDVSGTPLGGVPVIFNTQSGAVSVEPYEGATATASDGTWSLSLVQGLGGVVTLAVAPSDIGKTNLYRFNVNIPATATAPFSSILVDN